MSSYLRHRALFVSHAPDRLGTSTALLAWSRAIGEAILCRKRPGVRRDTSYPRAPATYSDRRRKLRYLRHRCRKYVIYDTAARSRQTPVWPDAASAVLAWCRAIIIEAILYPKQSRTRRDTPYPGAPVA